MKLSWLTQAIDHDGPLTTVHLDTTRTDPQAVTELEARWQALRSQLVDDGAPEGLLADIAEAVLSPSAVGGRHGRTIIAADDEILVDRVLPVPPLEDSAQRAEQACLLPLVRLTPYAVSQLLVLVDRAGADLHLRAPQNPSITQGPNGLGKDSSVDGGHDVLHKSSLGGGSKHGWRADNYEARVEDSWERNADAVASVVDRIVRERDPDMLLVSGDVRAVGLLKDALGVEARERLQEIPGGARSVGMDSDSFREEVARATEQFIAGRERQLLSRFTEHQGRDGDSVAGAAEVSQALERGQVQELILVTGREPVDVEGLILGALRTDAGVSSVSTEGADIPDGVAALLRWRDDATPSNRIGSMSGDARRERTAPVGEEEG